MNTEPTKPANFDEAVIDSQIALRREGARERHGCHAPQYGLFRPPKDEPRADEREDAA